MVWYDVSAEASNSISGFVTAQKAVNDHLRSCNRASVATTDPVTGEVQTFVVGGAPDQRRIWDGSAWQPMLNVGLRGDETTHCYPIASLSATDEFPVLIVPGSTLKRRIVAARLVCKTTETSNGTDHWVFDLQDRGIAGGAGSSILTSTLDTNGSAFAPWVSQSLAIDSSLALLANSRTLTLVATKNGSATTLVNLTLFLELSGE